MANGNRSNGNAGATILLTVVVVIAVLYFARLVFIPLALAVLFAFMLAPLVIRLRHWGLGRVPSAFIVVLFAFVVMAILGTILASQLTDLARKLPEYEQNVNHKLASLRSSGGGVVNRISRVASNLAESLTPAPASAQNRPNGEKPVAVEIRRSPFSPIEVIQKVLGSVLNMGLMAAIVVVFVIFMLIQREDLRDRLLVLAGQGRINVTTQVFSDAAERVSRYLLAQLVVNLIFGTLAGIGLFFMHVPNPLLWGILAVLLRYIPYLGIWVAASMPAAVAFAVEPGWMRLPAIFGLYFGIDLFMYNFVEPLLYGTSTGISPIAILVAAVFWTWLWGPVGLLLATPLTVCVMVLGRHVPSLQFLSVMLGDEVELPPETRFYQRMLAKDLDDATKIAEEYLKGRSLEDLYDHVIIPALSLAEEERHRGRLDESRQKFLFQNTRLLIEDLADRADELITGDGSSRHRNGNRESTPSAELPAPTGPAVLCVPARDEADEIAGLMLTQLLRRKGINARSQAVGALVGECIEEVGRDKPGIACILAVPPFGFMHARYLCRRFRAEFQDIKLLAGILTEHDVEEVRQRQPALTADELGSSLKQLLAGITSFLPVADDNTPKKPILSTS